MRHSMCARHSTARQPFDAICVMPCRTIAADSGIMASRMPISSMPPAMPKMPDRNDVTRTPTASVASMGSVSMADGGPMSARVRRPRHAGNAMKAIRASCRGLRWRSPWRSLASGFGARFGVWDFRAGFAILRYGTYARPCRRRDRVDRARSFRACARAMSAARGVAPSSHWPPPRCRCTWLWQARALPPINDITTDRRTRRAFVAILPLRASSAGAGELCRRGNRRGAAPRAIPTQARSSRRSRRPPRSKRALAAARDWVGTIVAAEPAAGRIEATATTPWFGFRDDVVIRVAPNGAGSRIDVRSVSRIGKSDLGANARRIRDFTSRLATMTRGRSSRAPC